MKNLLFVSVAILVFSGTSFTVSAQKKLNSGPNNGGNTIKKPVRFIEGIELTRESDPVISNVNYIKEVSTIAPSSADNKIESTLPIQFKYAQILNRNVESVSNFTLYNFIEDWWETRYRYGGTNRKGIDCSAFTGFLLNNVYDLSVPRTARDQYNSCDKIDRENLSEGDLVFFNTRGGVSHVGVYLGDGYFVHASTSNGVTINNLEDDYYSTRFLGGGRVHPAQDSIAGSN